MTPELDLECGGMTPLWGRDMSRRGKARSCPRTPKWPARWHNVDLSPFIQVDMDASESNPLEHWIWNIEHWILKPKRGLLLGSLSSRLAPAAAALLLLFSFAPAARAATPDPTRTFVEAARAYDENRLPDAIAGWESLLDQGQVLPDVLFNLGNAYYRNGQLGRAIRAYRHAQTLAPRDPDIRANLGFAAQTAGITLPARHPVAALLLDASRSEWRVTASAAFWLLGLALAAWILWPRHRFLSRPAAAVFALLLALALAGLAAHHRLRRVPEAVVMAPGRKVLSGPLDTSTPLLAIPEGAIVRQLDRRGAWVEIQTDSTRGWLPASALQPVL